MPKCPCDRSFWVHMAASDFHFLIRSSVRLSPYIFREIVTEPVFLAKMHAWFSVISLLLFACTASLVTLPASAPAGLVSLTTLHSVLLTADGNGVAQYTCNGSAWLLTDVLLNFTGDVNGKKIRSKWIYPTCSGTSNASSWNSEDGSALTGNELNSFQIGSDLPWVWYSVAGSGLFSRISRTLRLLTSGGAVPTDQCTAAQTGNISTVNVTCTFYFWVPVIPSEISAAQVPNTFPIALPANIPANLQNASSAFTPILKVAGDGTQEYICNGSTWIFVQPYANLSLNGKYLDGTEISSSLN